MTVINMRDLDLSGKTVLVRQDLNVPVRNGQVSSDQRILASVPTIRLALEAGAGVLVMSHLGRPQEGVPEAEFSLDPVAAHMAGLLEQDVPLVRDYLDKPVTCPPGSVVMLENVRFNRGEKPMTNRCPSAMRHSVTSS